MGDIVAMLDAEGIQKAHIVGHDWGCFPTYLAARAYVFFFLLIKDTGISIVIYFRRIVDPTPGRRSLKTRLKEYVRGEEKKTIEAPIKVLGTR